MKLILIAAVLTLLSSTVSARTLTIGLDLSGSNPLVSSKEFAYGASLYVSKEIMKLKNRDVVVLKTFGSRSAKGNLITNEYVLTRRLKPKKVAGIVSAYINSLPSQTDISQGSTSLVSWLEFTSGFDCENESHILAISDAIDSSSATDSKALESQKDWLPEPDVSLKGCKLTFYGLGAGMPYNYVKTIRNEWRDWSQKAGANFDAVIP